MSTMKAFICVYRHPQLGKEKKPIEAAAKSDTLLAKFLNQYNKTTNFYDLGDDPAFFAAKEIFNNENYATWGVCRRDVRQQVNKDDLIIFFCGRQEENRWDYYYVGFGTIEYTMKDRHEIWEKEIYKDYRMFYNLLINSDNEWFEPFGIKHPDWKTRVKAPYIFFSTIESLTDFNLINPIKVATCKPSISLIENWYSDIPLVKEIETCLFTNQFNPNRRLRINNHQIAHRHIQLHNINNNTLHEIRDKMKAISDKIRLTHKS